MDSVRSPDWPVAPGGAPTSHSLVDNHGGPASAPTHVGRAALPAASNPAAHLPPAVPGDASRPAPPIPVKIVIAGGFGVGKTTAVGAISEIVPLTTEAVMTAAGIGIDDPGQHSTKTTTTVAMDFGCVTIDRSLKLYLFGTPGQARFGFMWDDLTEGALGALVVVDSARLDDCYPAVDYFEQTGLPFVVAVNAFDGELAHDLESIRWALAISEHVPLVQFDARDRISVRDALLVVLDRALDRATRDSRA